MPDNPAQNISLDNPPYEVTHGKPFRLFYRTNSGAWINLKNYATQAEARSDAPAQRLAPDIQQYTQTTFALCYQAPDPSTEEFRTYFSVYDDGQQVTMLDW